MAYRDQVRDEAIAAAKAYSHPEVEPRHLLWGLVEVLEGAVPPAVERSSARALLAPRGTATAPPSVPAAIEARLAGVTGRATALELCGALDASFESVDDLPAGALKNLKPAAIAVSKQGKLTRLACSYPEGILFTHRTKAQCKVQGDGNCTADPAACKVSCD